MCKELRFFNFHLKKLKFFQVLQKFTDKRITSLLAKMLMIESTFQYFYIIKNTNYHNEIQSISICWGEFLLL